MTTTPISAGPAGPQLTDEHRRQLAAAGAGMKTIRRAVSVAAFNGWTIAIFAGFTLLFGLTSWSGILMGLGMGAIAVVEFRGAAGLRRFEAEAARMLGFNQLALGSLLALYALWSIYISSTGGGELAAMGASDPQVAEMLKPFEGVERMITLMVYGGMILVAVFGQGGMAMFYFSRSKRIREFRMQTPAWIVQMHAAGVFGGDSKV